MKIVVDTNIVFSALLKANSSIGDILLSPHEELDFYAPELLKEELHTYAGRIRKYSKLNELQLNLATEKIMARITLLSEDLISDDAWKSAYILTKEVDEDDTPFLALAIELRAILWTGDMKLIDGVINKGAEFIISTSQLINLLNN